MGGIKQLGTLKIPNLGAIKIAPSGYHSMGDMESHCTVFWWLVRWDTSAVLRISPYVKGADVHRGSN